MRLGWKVLFIVPDLDNLKKTGVYSNTVLALSQSISLILALFTLNESITGLVPELIRWLTKICATDFFRILIDNGIKHLKCRVKLPTIFFIRCLHFKGHCHMLQPLKQPVKYVLGNF